jgi:hypothetical protein
MTTVPFEPRNPQQDPLLARAVELPQDVAPPHDLWPAIAARLDAEAPRAPSRPLGWPAALVAGFLVASVSALLTWGLMREPAPSTEAMPPDRRAATAIVPVHYGSNTLLTAADLGARDALLVQFRDRLEQLSPATQEAVVRNLAVIQRAADEIDAALTQDPASALLNDLLLAAYKQELQLYSKVVTAGGGPIRRT